MFRRAADLAERLVKEHPGVAEYQGRLAAALGNLANESYRKGRFEDCVRLNGQALSSIEAALLTEPSSVPYRSSLAKYYDATGLSLERLTRPEEALAKYRRAMEILEGLTVEQPAVIEYQNRLSE